MPDSLPPLGQIAADMKAKAEMKPAIIPPEGIAASVKGGSTTDIALMLGRNLFEVPESVPNDNQAYRDTVALDMQARAVQKQIETIVNPEDRTPAISARNQEMLNSRPTAALGEVFKQRWLSYKPEVSQRAGELETLTQSAKEIITEQQKKSKEIVKELVRKPPEDPNIQAELEQMKRPITGLRGQTTKLDANIYALVSKLDVMLKEMGHEPEKMPTYTRPGEPEKKEPTGHHL